MTDLQPFLNIVTNNRAELDQNNLRRRLSSVQTISLTVCLALFFGGMFNWLTDLWYAWVPELPEVALLLGAAFCFVSYQIAKRKFSLVWANRASYLTLAALIVTLTLVQLTNDGLNILRIIQSAFLIAPLLAGLLGLNGRGIAFTAFVSYLASCVGTGLERAYALNPDMRAQFPPFSFFYYINWSLVFAVIGFSVYFFTRRLNQTTTDLQDQALRLTEVLIALRSTTKFGSILSQELSGLTSQLTTNSNQYGSQLYEQVASVTQVTTGLAELSHTADQIAMSSNEAATAAYETVMVATEVREANLLAQQTTAQGTESVEQTVSSVERVRNRIEILGQRLLNLTEQTRRAGAIIDIIEDIADETHLLALNASIEAVSGTAHDSSKRSDRFGVIAQEVKGLADRSRESTEEVRQVIMQMQGAVAAAVLVAEEGKKDTSAALSRSQIAGSVIEKLQEVVEASVHRADNILEAAEQVKTRCDEISLATGQQRSANQQILYTMQDVSQISRENVVTLSHFSVAVARVNSQIGELNGVLTDAAAIAA